MRLPYGTVIVTTSLAVLLSLLGAAPSHAAGAAAPHVAVAAVGDPGKYHSANERCVADVTHVDIGGYCVLTIIRDLQPVASVNDVTGLAWLPGNRLVYSVSGLFGEEPGIHVFDCATGHTRIIVGKGEYFELLGASAGKNPMLFFFYSADVASKTSDRVYQVRMDGTGLAKVTSSQ
jgi:hypothetical protein